MKLNDQWKSRKLWMYILVMVAGTVIWFYAKDSVFTDWVDMAKWMTGIYMGGNGVNHIAENMNKSKGDVQQ